ncbi:MAG: serine/threonine protein kinase [Verrucomicrobia bacterium]|nr:serine/threonine protein kinase [Verrucomicrobiota bacterium]
MKSIANDPEIQAQALKLIKDPTSYQHDASLHSAGLPLETFEACLQKRVDEIDYFYAFLVNPDLSVVHHFMGAPPEVMRKIHDPLQSKYLQLFETRDAVVITPFKRPERPSGQRPRRENEGRPSRKRSLAERLENRPPPLLGGPNSRFEGRAFGKQIPPHLLALMQQETLMQVAAPIQDEVGNVVGAIAFFIDPESEFSRIMSVARPGESGETYAFDASGLMVSKSRFDDALRSVGLLSSSAKSSSALTLQLKDPGKVLKPGSTPGAEEIDQWPFTRIVSSTMEHLQSHEEGEEIGHFQESEVQPFRDYRGVDVVGAWTWLPQYQLGIATKIDTSEAFRPLEMLRWVFIVLILLLLLASIMIFLFSIFNIQWKQRLAEAQLEAKRLGQYHLEVKIGEGGMGTVYRAKHALLRRETAIKLLTPDKADDLSLQRFEREVKLTSRLTHPNTIQIYDYGHTPEGLFYYAMEYLDGLNLKELVSRYGPQSSARVVHILSQICESLQEAHRAGLIHRDIKPANIILCERGGVPDFVKVLDFGLVRHYGISQKENTQVTTTTTVSGTPQFLAPEAIRNPDDADPRSDIYAIGAVGYFMLTGHYVFEGQSMMEIFEKHLTQEPVPPSSRVDASICPSLEQALLDCLSKDLNDRPSSVSELAERLSSCPVDDTWSMTSRVEWWGEFHASGDDVNVRLSHAGTVSTSDKTVLIDFDDRS